MAVRRLFRRVLAASQEPVETEWHGVTMIMYWPTKEYAELQMGLGNWAKVEGITFLTSEDEEKGVRSSIGVRLFDGEPRVTIIAVRRKFYCWKDGSWLRFKEELSRR